PRCCHPGIRAEDGAGATAQPARREAERRAARSAGPAGPACISGPSGDRGSLASLIRPIRLFPDPVLKRTCDAVSMSEAEELIRDLVDTMRSQPRCVGLAAPQIGEPARVAVVDASSHPAATTHNGLLILVTPLVTASRGRE